ncbi:hypothetical protein [Streptomyces sp. NBC_00847]|uniref:hypothetical protein n=1 Tax=Streptomyces sp. NBC_00847 TaxID=2975850 RepID=UPI00225E309F|nr:hypothetical protein [Streptomyces sp. NBC_00847]MCX4885932.1 hypothetical protein [Streptomyces sp. NBC_00847]
MTVYALKHPDGRWLYHLPKPEAFGKPGFGSRATVTGVYADGQPMEKLHGDWWATDHEAERLSTTGQPAAKTTGYRLTDPSAESVRYPATLTVEEWSERSDREGETLWTLYTNVHEDQPALEHVYDGPVMVLEGREPPSPDERPWIAALPQALTERPEYKHLFPGRIPGLRAHLCEVIKTMPRVRHCFDNYNGYQGLHVVLSIQFDKPQTQWKADISRRTGKPLKTGRTVPLLVDRRLELPVPMEVFADTYEQALTAWDEQVAFWTGLVESATVAACSACKGTGHVEHGAEKYGR